MQALIFDDDIERQIRLSAELEKFGTRTFVTGNPTIAEATIRRSVVDLLIAPERVAGKLTHTLILLAEYRNPMVSAIMLTDRKDPDLDELFLLLPALHCIVATDCAPELVRKLATASMAGATDTRDSMLLDPSMRVRDKYPILPTFFSRRFVTHIPKDHFVMPQTAPAA